MRRFLFVFDTTGSMNSWIREVRNNVALIAGRVLDEDEDAEVGFLAYGDYCDRTNMIQDSTNPSFSYTGQVPGEAETADLSFFYDSSSIERWLAANRSTSGGDHPECVEYVLRYLRSYHVPHAKAAGDELIVMWVGDAPPHALSNGPYGNNPHGLNWQTELAAVKDDATFYMALCGPDPAARATWTTMATDSGGVMIDIRNINNLATTMIAVAKAAGGGLDEYADELREGGADAEMEEILVDLGATCHD